MSPDIEPAIPQLFVANLSASVRHYRSVLGFQLSYQYGQPAFYGEVRRGSARLNLRHVDTPVLDRVRAARDDLLAATIPVGDLRAMFVELQAAGATVHQAPRREAWGAETFIIADPDGNLLLFTQRAPTPP